MKTETVFWKTITNLGLAILSSKEKQQDQSFKQLPQIIYLHDLESRKLVDIIPGW